MKEETIKLIDGKIKREDVFKLIPEKYKYIEQDESGYWFAYIDRPKEEEFYTFKYSRTNFMELHFFCIDYAGDWKDSLFERPQKLKSVTQACVGKLVCISDYKEFGLGEKSILVGMYKGFWCVEVGTEFSPRPRLVLWKHAKRCPDVIYGDEDE